VTDQLDARLYGTNLFGDPIERKPSGPVASRFIVPPFTVLDTRSGDWQERKRAWLRMGIKGEVGRGGNLLAISDQCETYRQSHGAYESCRPHQGNDPRPGRLGGDYQGGDAWLASGKDTGTSVFDPTLCESLCRWFCPPGGQVVDPFAGGSVRGIVAVMIGLRYWGCDLRAQQIEANERQADEICNEACPVWVCGDSLETLTDAPEADFLFSCPPYGDLETYSDDPADLSNMEWHTFVATYRRIILRAVGRLKENRFACFVVGDFRDKRGFYRNFVSETITAFQLCGAKLYNEAILVNAVGSAAIRVTKQFDAGRKMCKTHQNVLVFCKGDWKEAARACTAKEGQP